MHQELLDREIIKYNSLVIDHNTYLVHYDGSKHFIPLKEFMTLSLFTSKPGRIFTRLEIMDYVGGKREVSDKTIDATIAKLRKRFGGDIIKTILNRGYGLNVEMVK